MRFVRHLFGSLVQRRRRCAFGLIDVGVRFSLPVSRWSMAVAVCVVAMTLICGMAWAQDEQGSGGGVDESEAASQQQSDPPPSSDEDSEDSAASDDSDASDASPVGEAESAQATGGLTAEQQRQLDLCRPTILNPSSDIELSTRRVAVEQLLSLHLDEGVAILAEALRSGNANIVEAVLQSLDAHGERLEALLPALTDALRASDPSTRDSLIRVLASYDEAGLQAVTALALDAEAPVAERVGAVTAMSQFQTQEVAGRLVALLNGTPPTPGPIREAAIASLGQMTGLTHGADIAAWRSWWADAQAMTPLQWQQSLLAQLNAKIAELQRSLDRRRGTLNETEARLLKSIRDTFRHLPVDRHTATLLELLDEPLAVSRQAALERIERVLRDQTIDPALQERLEVCVSDPAPSLRLRAAQLLHRLNDPAIGGLLAKQLPVETDDDVARGFILLIAEHPTVDAVVPVANRLANASLADAAATALWSLLRNPTIDGSLSDEDRITAVQRAKQAYESTPSPPVVQLVALIDSNDEMGRLIPLLDGSDAAIRVAVAAGFAARGLAQPLVDRIGSTDIYPFAVSTVARQGADLAQLRRLVEMTPPSEANVASWKQAIETLAGRLPHTELVAADDLLLSYEMDLSALRLSIFNRYAQLPVDDQDPAVRVRNIRRLASILVEQGQAGPAIAHLQQLNGQDSSPEFLEQKFSTALLAGEYEIAVQIHAEPGPWVAFFANCGVQSIDVCGALRAEILARFDGQLEGELRTQYDMICQQLDGGTAE